MKLYICLVVCAAFLFITGCSSNSELVEPTPSVYNQNEHDNDLEKKLMQIILEASALKNDGKLDQKYALYEIINNLETTISIEDWVTLGDKVFTSMVFRQGGILTDFLSEVFNLAQSSIEILYSNPSKKPTVFDVLDFGIEADRIRNFYTLENIVTILEYELEEAKNKPVS